MLQKNLGVSPTQSDRTQSVRVVTTVNPKIFGGLWNLNSYIVLSMICHLIFFTNLILVHHMFFGTLFIPQATYTSTQRQRRNFISTLSFKQSQSLQRGINSSGVPVDLLWCINSSGVCLNLPTTEDEWWWGRRTPTMSSRPSWERFCLQDTCDTFNFTPNHRTFTVSAILDDISQRYYIYFFTMLQTISETHKLNCLADFETSENQFFQLKVANNQDLPAERLQLKWMNQIHSLVELRRVAVNAPTPPWVKLKICHNVNLRFLHFPRVKTFPCCFLHFLF